MFAAPVRDLRSALIEGSLGALNPFPWSFCAGNCLGWVVYGYYTRDPFVVAANLPGFVLSIWLCSGASKLQYLELMKNRAVRREEEHWDASSPMETTQDGTLFMNDAARLQMEDAFVMVPQERALLRVLSAWSAIIVYVGWFSKGDPAAIVGVLVNINLIVFYGAPLQTIQKVVANRNADSIHVPTMVMNWTNTSFWIGYGVARRDLIIVIPNILGLALGLMQGLLKMRYPSQQSGGDRQPVPVADDDFDSTSIPEQVVSRENSSRGLMMT